MFKSASETDGWVALSERVRYLIDYIASTTFQSRADIFIILHVIGVLLATFSLDFNFSN